MSFETSSIPSVPSKEGEYGWSAIDEAIESGTSAADIVVKQAAAWQYHQFHIHGSENPLSATAMLDKVAITFVRLTPQEMERLRAAYIKLPPHYY